MVQNAWRQRVTVIQNSGLLASTLHTCFHGHDRGRFLSDVTGVLMLRIVDIYNAYFAHL